MKYTESDILVKHAVSLLDVREQMANLEMKAAFHKEALYRELMSLGVGSANILFTNDECLSIKNNLRMSKSFDKDGLSGKVGVDRAELDYAGVSELVERRRLTAADVEKFQSENTSQFVTVRKRKIKVGKKK